MAFGIGTTTENAATGNNFGWVETKYPLALTIFINKPMGDKEKVVVKIIGDKTKFDVGGTFAKGYSSAAFKANMERVKTFLNNIAGQEEQAVNYLLENHYIKLVQQGPGNKAFWYVYKPTEKLLLEGNLGVDEGLH
ncbi:hypothetical protein HNP86_001947 [Methanococcus maripaludis]|uniref:Uncharacterized protein n=1 Tax=Methanococcus maripaludis TaxID=39152 RepID=A0A7J9NVS7_METMI|nr:hypothetical protein [Methanococcus maripaludis]MBA2851788.1 hypothetical protein [Methanococcus maripaludis]